MILENGIYYYPRESDSKEGFAVRLPAGYTSTKRYPVWLIIHGVGERSRGLLEDLKNVMLGFDYDGPGPLPRQYAIATPDLKANVDKHGHILVVVTYPYEFNPNDVEYVMKMVEQDFSVDTTREAVIGFSLGGGAALRHATSSVAAASRWALVVVCAPVNWATNLKNVVDAKLQLIGTTNKVDSVVSPGIIKGIVNGINSLNPEIAARLIEFPHEGHGSFLEMLSGTHALIPQPMYDYLDNTSTLDRRPYPATAGPVPEKPVFVPTHDIERADGSKEQVIIKTI